MSRPPILDAAATLSDPTRCRILRLVDRHELTVTELCTVLQLPQSTVSRHLKTLSEGEWVSIRRDGTSNYYRLADEGLPGWARDLWQLVRDEIAADPTWGQDGARLESVLAERVERSQAFFASTAGEWDRLRDELFGARFDLVALAELLDPGWTVGDLACGTGRLSSVLAPAVTRIVAVDSSSAMLEAARARLDGFDNVEVREGRVERLPIADGTLHAAVLVLGLAYVSDPRQVLLEAFRVLRAGGRLLVVDLLPHDREELQRDMGQAWPGFEKEHLLDLMERAGLTERRFRPLPPDTAATGPALFAASARKAA